MGEDKQQGYKPLICRRFDRKVAEKVDISMVVLETDAPYVVPKKVKQKCFLPSAQWQCLVELLKWVVVVTLAKFIHFGFKNGPK